jgi:hypothetical protein
MREKILRATASRSILPRSRRPFPATASGVGAGHLVGRAFFGQVVFPKTLGDYRRLMIFCFKRDRWCASLS